MSIERIASEWLAAAQSIFRLISDGLDRISPLLLVVLASFGTAAVLLLITMTHNRRINRRKTREIDSVVKQFVEERSKSESILADLDIGVLAYSSDGTMINNNPAARKMLIPDPLPENLKEFVDRYGQDNGMQAALLLGRNSLTVKVQIGERILRVRLKESRFDEGRRAGTLIVIQDISDMEREEKQRKEFVANVSHELKTPLTTIKTYSESLLDWGLAEKSLEAIRKDVFRIHDDSLRMEHLVEDLLLLSSIDSKGIRTRMEQLDFVTVIRQTVDRLMQQALDKNLDLACYTLSKIPVVYADRTSIERIMTNLLSNAIKYTEKGGSIKVYISYLIDDIYVKVADTGFGIEKEHLPHIFNRFYRVDMTGSRMFGGTGLGLSIARELVELHNGKIEVESVLGKGTEFTVMLPCARKVFSDTVAFIRDGMPLPDVLHRSAAEDLLALAQEERPALRVLSGLSVRQLQALLDRILDNDADDRPTAADLVPGQGT